LKELVEEIVAKDPKYFVSTDMIDLFGKSGTLKKQLYNEGLPEVGYSFSITPWFIEAVKPYVNMDNASVKYFIQNG
jgi:hypothetical protein